GTQSDAAGVRSRQVDTSTRGRGHFLQLDSQASEGGWIDERARRSVRRLDRCRADAGVCQSAQLAAKVGDGDAEGEDAFAPKSKVFCQLALRIIWCREDEPLTE